MFKVSTLNSYNLSFKKKNNDTYAFLSTTLTEALEVDSVASCKKLYEPTVKALVPGK